MALVNAKWDGKNFVLSEEELVRLLESDMELNALERAGVDNWEWYGEAHGEYLMEECPGFDERGFVSWWFACGGRVWLVVGWARPPLVFSLPFLSKC